ncbi:MAG: DsrE/DsrF/DrsH-like family protein [Clostridia bacterium]|nr:DsrE/DsrF/DrsH-like family protein [Clostridia bacterium]
MEENFKTITAAEFAALDYSKYTLVDLREPDELIVSGIEGAINVPFSQFATKLDTVPKDKPVVVYCRVGDFSEQIAEILADRGYDVSHVEGGYNAYRKIVAKDKSEEPKAASSTETEPAFIDAKGLKCPGPIVKVADYLRDKPEGTKIRVEATEDAFYSDVQIWCERTGNKLDGISFTNGVIKAEITRRISQKPATVQAEQNDKTFVVFSGDLDKTIAAFIMANGAAAMGRKVTIFFTFWGLNILRRTDKVKVKKPFIEKMFGIMMPRGTKKLGLSRMNMGGMGAKMIRSIMKRKGVSSLEELIESAKAHGVRLVACQMSMDIMGIRKEELIDGVDLGGVSTFLGSGEQSDMSLFI